MLTVFKIEMFLAIVIAGIIATKQGPNSSSAGNTGSCTAGDGKCDLDKGSSGSLGVKNESVWKPFKITAKEKWISFTSLIENYVKWHGEALSDPDLPCSKRKVLIFEPNAGLGDSIGALTSGFLYALRAGRLFFINWKPFPWSVTFKALPFQSSYDKVSKTTSNKTGLPVICPDRSDKSSFLHGHVTHGHPIVSEAEGFDFHTDYDRLSHFFINPSSRVKEVIDDVMERHFHDDGEVFTHKVAIVMRTGIGEYNQFLSVGDEANFVECFLSYARHFVTRQEEVWRVDDVTPKKIKFSVLITSDNHDAKENAVKALREGSGDLDINVIILDDSIVHVMHMTSEESKLKRMRTKLRKTMAEFFLISMCDVRFLTHGSLFGRAAAEMAGDREDTNFYISDSNCDGKREKHSYLQCRKPKYPPICDFK